VQPVIVVITIIYWCSSTTGAALPENNEASALQMAEHLPQAQPDSIANHVTDRSISNLLID